MEHDNSLVHEIFEYELSKVKVELHSFTTNTQPSFWGRLVDWVVGNESENQTDVVAEHVIYPSGRETIPKAGNHLLVSENGKKVLFGSDRGEVKLWDPQKAHLVGNWKWPISRVHSLAFSPDGMLAAAGGTKGRVVIWDLD